VVSGRPSHRGMGAGGRQSGVRRGKCSVVPTIFCIAIPLAHALMPTCARIERSARIPDRGVTCADRGSMN
jgi:hypothetical protein